MKIEAGKYYRRRDGKVVGPVTTTKGQYDCYWWVIQKEAMSVYTKSGMKSISGYDKHDHDLVEEITDAALIAEVNSRPDFTFNCGDRK